MSSIFNFSGYQSPPRRPLIFPSPTSPFCTSPSQLQEVTLDQDVSLSNSIRSPSGAMRGRSVKEIEEQLAFLKKDNFNLKLRIYFLEERMGSNFNLDKENIVKKNIELMVDVESLRKELQEKHELLCQAVKAIELEDEEQKKLIAERDELANNYKQQVDELRAQLTESKTDYETCCSHSYQTASTNCDETAITNENSVLLKELALKNISLQEELNKEKETTVAIQFVLDQKDIKIKSLEAEVEMLKMNFDKDTNNIHTKYEELMVKQQDLCKRLNETIRMTEELSEENTELRKKQAAHTAELEKERKRFEKLKLASEQQTGDLHRKLESALNELKKSQDLVVSNKSVVNRPGGITESDSSFLVSQPATSPRSSQADTIAIPSIASPITITPATSPCPSINFNQIDNAIDLKRIYEQLQSERDLLQQKIVKLKAEQMKACKIIKSMIDSRNKSDEEISMLKMRNSELEDELLRLPPPANAAAAGRGCSSVTSSNIPHDENSMEEHGGELIEQYKALTDQLEEKNKILVETIAEKRKQFEAIQVAYEELIAQMKSKDDRIIDLEFELLSQQEKSKHQILDDPELTPEQKDKLTEMEKEIVRLNNELKKKNYDLQGLVNNELWEKNREIEKLQKRQASKIIETKDQEIVRLQTEVASREAQLNVLKWKISELGFDIDEQNGDVVTLETNLKAELEKSEKLRLQANEVCCVLNTRLEELAVFLDSLLKQKTILGFLGIKENKRLRQIIDQSLDMSRSLTMSMIFNPEQSLLQLTSISSILNDTENNGDADNASRLSLLPANISLTYQNHLYKQNSEEENAAQQIIETLREQIVNLKYELQLRDVELNKLNGASNNNCSEMSTDKEQHVLSQSHNKSSTLNTSTTLKNKSENQSESEDWSEPDRNVSRERIGLVDVSSKSSSRKKSMTETTDSTDESEEEEEESESITQHSRTTSSKKTLLSESRSTIIELNQKLSELDQKLNDKELEYVEAMKLNKKLQSDVDILESKLKEAENKKFLFEIEVNNLQKEKQRLETNLSEIDKESSKKMNELGLKESELLLVVQEAEEAAATAKAEMNETQRKLSRINDELAKMERKLRAEYEQEFVEKITKCENESLKTIELIRIEAEKEVKALHEAINRLKADYSENYVKKSDVEETLTEAMKLTTIIQVLEERIDDLSNENRNGGEKLKESVARINELRNDLDNATLQYSEAVLDKTKIANEKTLIEQELSKAINRECELKKRLDDVDSELTCLRHTYQTQVSALQQQKSKLEVRTSELEQCNAELHNRLVKIQAGFGDQMLSSSLPNSSNFVNQMVTFRRQLSENSSSYLSEDHLLPEELRSVSANRNFSVRTMGNNHNVDAERHEANSSPDLGIESDHGRFSSLETHINIPRPLLQTLELTESMSNLLDGENNQVQSVGNCDSDHCCEKTMVMANENSDLKRKLLRTRRALEETVTQLTLANQRKKQVEKTICKQIHKTSQVLRKAKANLDSGSETDVYKK